MHWRNSQSKAGIKCFGLDVFDVLAAELRESIKAYIPEIISLLSDSVFYVRRVGANALSKVSEHGKEASKYLACTLLMY